MPGPAARIDRDSPPASRTRQRRSTPSWLAVLIGAGAYVAALAVTPDSLRSEVSNGVTTAVMSASAVALWRLAARRGPAGGRPWRFAAASALSASLIFAVWLIYDVVGATVGVPSLADIPFFFAVLLMMPAALALPQRASSRGDRMRLVLDGAIIAASLLAISWHVLLGDTLRNVTTGPLQTLVLTAYPLADVTVVSVALLIATRIHPHSRRAVLFLAGGVLALAAGDSVYGYLSLSGSWSGGHPATVLWVIGYPMMVLGARAGTYDASKARDVAADTSLPVAVLVVPVVLALAVTLAHFSPEGLAAAVVLVGLLLVRQTSSLCTEMRLRAGLEQEVAAQTEALRLQAYQDPVTGLGNRALLRDHAASPEMRAGSTAMVLLDLDGFKEVNDSLGHASGDDLLLRVGDRLGGCVRAQDTVVRLGGDEFAVLLPDAGMNSAGIAADRILRALRDPFALDWTEVRVRGSIGIALGDASGDLDLLLRNADLAMYEAKARGGDQACVFDPRMHDRLKDRMQLENEVRDAVARRQFTVYYQPIVDTASGEVCGLEALVRWDHPERGVVPPFEFLPAAEKTGVITELGAFVLRTACEQMSRWRTDWPELTVAVNLSQRQLLDPDLGPAVTAILAETGLPTHALHLEVTETVLAAEAEINRALERLTAVGVCLSIDDFGTGHSSLSRLRQLPAQRLKIDKSFIAEIDAGEAPLLSSIIALAHSLGRTVVAEGVETPEQLAFLVDNGCDEVQGYLFSRPVPEAHVVAMLFGTRMPDLGQTRRSSTAFSSLVSEIAGADVAPDRTMKALLRELTALSGLDTTFFTTIDRDLTEQVTRSTHNAGAMTIEEGLTVAWGDTLCRRMIEDDVLHSSEVSRVYSGVEAARALGIETYVSVPIRHADGTLVGTLCGASAEPRQLDNAVLELMQLFAQVLSERMDASPPAATNGPSPASRDRHAAAAVHAGSVPS